ncbi:DUF2294 domain-containing protein [Argonema galeatum]|uniref:DUF2294 domain-containing protein n=1 Tax=Argonema galeatum TaxID=2942762 RepID=UPI0020129A81|nr:DUF2294 domain-containing protein [Argonema galeatum]MCL1465497.1 DUF2294 domain-containing protein [Argonema galeatum A003/A1]
MDKPRSNLTRQQLEQVFSQRIQDLYRNQVGHQPDKVTCQLFDNKLAIVLENAISRPVQLLAKNDRSNLAQQVRSNVDAAIKPQLVEVIEEVIGVSVVDLLIDTTIETGRTGIIAVLDVSPTVSDASCPTPSQTRDGVRR